MTWKFAMEYARRKSIETGKRWYVQGYQRQHNSVWRYGAYDTKQVRRPTPR
jgi:hypothetical protein